MRPDANMTKQFDLWRAVKIGFAFAWAMPWTTAAVVVGLTVVGLPIALLLAWIGVAPLCRMLRVTPEEMGRRQRIVDEERWALHEEPIPPWILEYERQLQNEPEGGEQ